MGKLMDFWLYSKHKVYCIETKNFFTFTCVGCPFPNNITECYRCSMFRQKTVLLSLLLSLKYQSELTLSKLLVVIASFFSTYAHNIRNFFRFY